MNGLKASIHEVLEVRDALAGPLQSLAVDVMLGPPATLLVTMVEVTRGSRLAYCGQDCHWAQSGAHTGDLAAAMLKEAGARAVIAGHSERRSDHGETSAQVKAKSSAAHAAGLAAIICLGETRGEREAGLTDRVVARQLQDSLPDTATSVNTIIAYEPVWAIGTGLTPSPGDVAAVHTGIRRGLKTRFGSEGASMRILYGGSVKPENARSLLLADDVNGALVGGASLKAKDFLAIVQAYNDGR